MAKQSISPATHLIIKGAREHNLKNISLTIPKNKLVVFTGVSGSGKSSLAHDTIYAEGQRRYVESLSSYARQFLGVMDKPDLDKIEGLSPAVMIDQKQGASNPRSTVGTVTEIYDYLRLLYAKIGHPHCPNCNKEVSPQEATQIKKQILSLAKTHPSMDKNKGVKLLVMSPIIKNKKGEFKQLLSNLYKKGITSVRVDGKFIETKSPVTLFKNNHHNIDALMDKIIIEHPDKAISAQHTSLRLQEAIEHSLELSTGEVLVGIINDIGFSFPQNPQNMDLFLFSENLSCPHCNISIPKLEPRHFSFNSPDGACPECTGLGSKLILNTNTILAPNLTLKEGAIIPLAGQFESNTWFARLITHCLEKSNFDTTQPIKKLTSKQKDILFYGTGETSYSVNGTNSQGQETIWNTTFAGLAKEFEKRHRETTSSHVRTSLERFMIKQHCPLCQGNRLKKEITSVTINNISINKLTALPVNSAINFLKQTSKVLTDKELQISKPIIKEVKDRLNFLNSVGLEYLTLNREAGTLSGGELQRIRLSAQIGSRLTGILYCLDEPTIGLHEQDNHKLIKTLKNMVKLGNTLIVVEHDKNVISSADHILEFGPLAGERGGELTFQGNLEQLKVSNTLTGKYLSNRKTIKLRKKENRETQNTDFIELSGCTHHNLKNISVKIPTNKFIGITGVSGSGKSSLIVDTLCEALSRKLNARHKTQDIKFNNIKIPNKIKKVSLINQNPIGRTPRSNPATYTKTFDYIRKIFANTKEARIRGYNSGRFSFNVKGGRCEACSGEGQNKIEMQFLGDIYIKCETCAGTRYNEPTLEIEYQGKNISQVLDMTIEESAKFFQNSAIITHKLNTLIEVGLGYIKLGQIAPTLSGGEAQRIKLATELTKINSRHTIYILDEPTTGLHFHDLNKLLHTLNQLVQKDNTVIVIEHNLDLIKNTDYIIDMGPKGGESGGEIIATGTPNELIKKHNTPTGIELKKYLKYG